LAAKPWFIPEQTTLLDQLQEFRKRHEHFALMVDEYGSFMGIVTLEDILEEIVGDISDEHDVAVPGVVPQADGSYIINGSVTIRDLNREFDWRLPDEEAATVAGLIMHESRRIPEPGQIFMFHGLRFQIAQRVRQQIMSVRVTPVRENQAPE
jgi:Mg2+/Co2+ transporter CorB